ncbi:MAG TPA: hypothetical protein VJU82_04570 [Acidobacteriaceae bacterium]|nr:hypothetical protein [Acidobacteriaceae bacterium]
MRKLVVAGWNTGFHKIGFTKLLREEFGCSLSDAKAFTDAVLDGKPVHLNFPEDRFDAAVAAMSKLGAVFHEEGL